MPDQDEPAFSLTTTFAPNNRNILAAFMAVDSDPGDGYGDDPRAAAAAEHQRVRARNRCRTRSSRTRPISSQLNLLRNGGSSVIYGNLLTLPVAGGLLYVEPVYVAVDTGSQLPPAAQGPGGVRRQGRDRHTLTEALNKVLGVGNTGAGRPAEAATGGGTAGGGTTGARPRQRRCSRPWRTPRRLSPTRTPR